MNTEQLPQNTKQRLIDAAARSADITAETRTEGRLGLYLASKAWKNGIIEPLILASVPEEMTPTEAKELGWALYQLGKCGASITETRDHSLDDGSFFD